MDVVNRGALLVFLLLSFVVFGQNTVLSKKYNVSSGLLANDVQALCLDQQGVLWIGSSVGVSKIANAEVEIEQSIDDFSFTNVTSILQDPSKGMWFSSYGQGVLYKDESKILSYTMENSLVSDRVKTMSIFGNLLYVGTLNGISIINLDTHQILTPIIQKQGYLPFEVTSFFEFDQQVYATTISHGVCRVSQNSIVSENNIKAILSSARLNNLLFYGTQEDLIVQDFVTKEIVYQQNIPNIVHFEQVKGELYIVSSGFFDNQGGVFRWENNKVDTIKTNIHWPNNGVMSMTYDQLHDFLYVGSADDGVFQIDMSSALSLDTSMSNVMAVEGIKQHIFVFSDNGLDILKDGQTIKNLSLDTFKYFQQNNYKRFKDQFTKENYFFEIDYSIPADRIVFFRAIAHKNSIWVSTNIGLFQISSQGDLLNYYNLFTFHFEFTQDQLVEVMPYQGVRVFTDLQQMDYRNYIALDAVNIPKEIVSIVKIEDTIYFASANDGLYSYDSKQGFISFLEKGWFEQKRLKILSKGPNGILYIATDTNDIYALQVGQGMFSNQKIIERSQIIGSDLSFISSNEDKLIVGSNKGLSIFREHEIFYFDQEQGFQPNKVNAYLQKGNRLYLGTIEGLYSLDTQYFAYKQRDLQVQLLEILVNGSSGKKLVTISEGQKTLDLGYDSNSLQISFFVTGSKFPKKLYFHYRLKPNGNWRKVRDNRIELHYLEPGNYPIELKIKDYDSGQEILEPLLFVKIRQPYYQSIWFISGSFIGIIGFMFILYRTRILQLKRKQSVKAKKLVYDKRLAEVKLLAVRSQMNAHFIFNVLSSIQFYILKGNQDQAFDYLGKFAHLIRESLNLSTKERISIARELDYLKDYVEIENMRLDDRVEFIIESFDDIDLKSVFIPPMLLQPFIENALVHAFPISVTNPKLTISISKLNSTDLLIVIQDNGIGGVGASKKHNYKSKGMGIVRQRMALIQEYLEQDIKTFTSDQGSRVELILKKIVR